MRSLLFVIPINRMLFNCSTPSICVYYIYIHTVTINTHTNTHGHSLHRSVYTVTINTLIHVHELAFFLCVTHAHAHAHNTHKLHLCIHVHHSHHNTLIHYTLSHSQICIYELVSTLSQTHTHTFIPRKNVVTKGLYYSMYSVARPHLGQELVDYCVMHTSPSSLQIYIHNIKH